MPKTRGVKIVLGVVLVILVIALIYLWRKNVSLADNIQTVEKNYQTKIIEQSKKGESSFVNTSGDTMSGKLEIKSDLSAVNVTFQTVNSNSITSTSLTTTLANITNLILSGDLGCANCIELGAETTGDYLASLTAGADISITGSAGEGGSLTVADISTLQSVTGRGAFTTNAITINSTGDNLILQGGGTLRIVQSAGPGTTTDRLYNVGGNLIWNGVNLIAGGPLPVGIAGQTLYHNGTVWTATSNLYHNGTNVGIGTTSPQTSLHIDSAGAADRGQLSLSDIGAGGDTWLSFYEGSAYQGWLAWYATDNYLSLQNWSAGSYGSLALNHLGGNVGVGLNNPSHKLQIADSSTTANRAGVYVSQTGTIAGTGYAGYFSKTGASTTNVGLYATASEATYNYAAVFPSGFVGIGTATPLVLTHISQSSLGSEALRLESAATNDDPNFRVFQNRAATTDATETTLHNITLNDDSIYYVRAYVIGRRTGGVGGAAGDSAGYELWAIVKRSAAGTATLVGSAAKNMREDNASWDANIDVSGNDTRVRITGDVNNNITWHVTVEIQNMSS